MFFEKCRLFFFYSPYGFVFLFPFLPYIKDKLITFVSR